MMVVLAALAVVKLYIRILVFQFSKHGGCFEIRLESKNLRLTRSIFQTFIFMCYVVQILRLYCFMMNLQPEF